MNSAEGGPEKKKKKHRRHVCCQGFCLSNEGLTKNIVGRKGTDIRW